MPEHTDPADPLGERLRSAGPGLAALLAEAQRTWVSRAHDRVSRAHDRVSRAHDPDPDPDAAAPGWRPFEDAFPTFYQFTNRPR